VHLAHKLAETPEGGLRYTAPSLLFTRTRDGQAIEAPGFQPSLVYEVAIANLEPELARRPAPESVEQLLAWAGEPLATQEVAEVMGIGADEAREALAAATGVAQHPAGTDAFWTVAAAELAQAA
jgi:hypothetical protein